MKHKHICFCYTMSGCFLVILASHKVLDLYDLMVLDHS